MSQPARSLRAPDRPIEAAGREEPRGAALLVLVPSRHATPARPPAGLLGQTLRADHPATPGFAISRRSVSSARKTNARHIVAEAHDATGIRLSEVRLTAINVYDFTAAILAWGAHRAAAGALHGTGALGPVEGFRLGVLQTGAAEAGLARE